MAKKLHPQAGNYLGIQIEKSIFKPGEITVS